MRALAARIFALSLIVGPAHASSGWTFCVAEAGGGRDIWITGVFPAVRDRERLEAEIEVLPEKPRDFRHRAMPGAQGRQGRGGQRAIHGLRVPPQARRTLHEVFAPELDSRR